MGVHSTDWLRSLARDDPPSSPAAPQVRLVGYPVVLGRLLDEYTEEIFREVQVLAVNADHLGDGIGVLQRLAGLNVRVSTEWGDLVADQSAARERAEARGEHRVDLRYPLIDESRQVLMQYAVLTEELDACCRRGELLNPEPAPPLRALRRWTISEFVRQYDGEPAQPWDGPLR